MADKFTALIYQATRAVEAVEAIQARRYVGLQHLQYLASVANNLQAALDDLRRLGACADWIDQLEGLRRQVMRECARVDRDMWAHQFDEGGEV